MFVASCYLEIGREGESGGWGAGEMGTEARNLLVRGQAWKKAEGRGGEVGVALERDGGSFRRIRGEVMAATEKFASLEARIESGGLEGKGMGAEVGWGRLWGG